MKTSVPEYIDLLYEKLGKLAFEEIQYSDYDQMTDWLAEINNRVKKLEKKQEPMKPTYGHECGEFRCSFCGDWVSGWEERPNYCSQCGQAIEWEDNNQ